MDLTSLSTDGAAKEEPLSGVLRNMGTSAFIFGEHGDFCYILGNKETLVLKVIIK